jgi:hypothetical protein
MRKMQSALRNDRAAVDLTPCGQVDLVTTGLVGDDGPLSHIVRRFRPYLEWNGPCSLKSQNLREPYQCCFPLSVCGAVSAEGETCRPLSLESHMRFAMANMEEKRQ